MRLQPRSLFGLMMLVLAVGLVLSELVSQTVNFIDRGSGVYRLGAQQTAHRIAEAARILSRLPPEQRGAVIGEMSGTTFSVVLAAAPIDVGEGYAEHDRYEQALSGAIQRNLPPAWRTSVEIVRLGRERRPRNYAAAEIGPFEQWIARHFYYILPGAYSVVSQIRLEDGTMAVFYARIPQEPLSRLETLLPRLLLSLAIFTLLGAVAIATITRSLKRLAGAAERAGTDPEGAPMPEEGPREVRSVIRAFNNMRLQLRRYVMERARIFGAMSHDLRTPITRMRLRAEMIDDAAVRSKFVRDLDEMEAMAGSALEVFRSLGAEPRRQPLDVGALVESMCEDWVGAGRDVETQGRSAIPYNADPGSLRRCLDNLVENALRYGGRARISIEDDQEALRIVVRDDGPGIPEQDLERVFEPFVRLDSSRSRESGGTGLGLAIARNIARTHGGDIALRNAPDGKGLIAELILPRESAPEGDTGGPSAGVRRHGPA